MRITFGELIIYLCAEGDPAYDFQMDWVDNWKMTENFRIFQKFTDSELFDLVPPKHVMAGGLTMEDVQRRIVQCVICPNE